MWATEDHSEQIADDAPSLTTSLRPSPSELIVARRQLHLKAIVIGALLVGSYRSLVVVESSIVVDLASAVVMVVALTAAATCVFHDGNHGHSAPPASSTALPATPVTCWVRARGSGGSNTTTSITATPRRRQPWRPWHRYQHLYMWVLYGFLTLQWFLISDFVDLKNRGVHRHRFPHQPRRRDVIALVLGKALHCGWAVALPLVYHSWWVVLVFYICISWTVGLLLATMFQLAHCMDLAEFPAADAQRRGPEFVAHQLRTTVDVWCRTEMGRRSLRWVMGGLDFQVEHHLAPRLPHTVYPIVAARLGRACAEGDLAVRSHPSPWQAIRSHGRWLRLMGARPSLGRSSAP